MALWGFIGRFRLCEGFLGLFRVYGVLGFVGLEGSWGFLGL